MADEPKISFKKFKSKNIRKRPIEDDVEAGNNDNNNDDNSLSNETIDNGSGSVVVKKKRDLDRGISASSGISALKKHKKTYDNNDEQGQDFNLEQEGEEKVKGSFGGTAKFYNAYKATGTSSSLLPKDAGATRTYDPNAPVEGKGKKEGTVLNADDLEKLEGSGEGDQVYKGLSGYKDYKPKKREEGSLVKTGPMKAVGNVRMISRFDYQPDICKDYKETGYCGYGDSCIFMHDRSDYKSGWQMERDWEEEQKKKKAEKELENFLAEDDEYEYEEYDADGQPKKKSKPATSTEDDKLPFACLICRKEFVNPIVTKCNHYFCEACALKHHRSSPKCFACGAATNGVFSVAKVLVARLAEKKRRVEELEEERKQMMKESGILIEGEEEEGEGNRNVAPLPPQGTLDSDDYTDGSDDDDDD